MSGTPPTALMDRESPGDLHDSDLNHALLDDLHTLLVGLEDRPDDALETDVRRLEQAYGAAVYAELLYLLSHLRFPAEEAKPHWERILEHRKSMAGRLGSPVDLRVALASFFVEVNRQLKNPKIIEMRLFERERASACRDDLTGLFNYRMFREQLEREMSRSSRSSSPLSVVMLDIDHFKQYNDANGHESGNKALEAVAGLLEGSLRKADIAARYGGEEFALILPCTPKTSAHVVGERIREAIEQYRFQGEEALPRGELTLSAGLATYPADAADPGELVRNADRALYMAKAAGRNQVVLYGQSRRSYGRVSIELPGRFRTMSDESRPLTTINVSEAGILFHADHAVPVGSLIEVAMQLDPGRTITASGRVVHVETTADGSNRTAVHITDARNADRARLMKIVREAVVVDLPAGDLTDPT